jgi:hypothetical protein
MGVARQAFQRQKRRRMCRILAAPMHVARLCYLVARAELVRPKRLPDAKYFLRRLILKYLFKKN